MRQGRLDDPEWRIDVGLHRGVEILCGDVEDRSAGLLPASVADHDVEPAETLNGALDQLLAEFLVPEIAGDRQSDPPLGLDQVYDLLRIRFFVWKIIDRDVCAFARIGDGGGAAHAGIATRDQRLAAR